MKYDCGIVGGGAAGLMAAAELARHGKRVCILEKQERVGRKLLSTGNGRCNLTNMDCNIAHYHGDTRYAEGILRKYPPKIALERFAEMGIPTRTDAEGRVYPMSNQAASVLDALRLTAAERGVDIVNTKVSAIHGHIGNFTADDADAEFARMLICTGGLAAPKLGADGSGYSILQKFGHRLVPRFPALTPLCTSRESVRGLKGQRLECKISMKFNAMYAAEGEIIFGEDGISGIAAMGMGHMAGEALARGKKPILHIHILENASEAMEERLRNMPKRAAEDFCTGIVPKRIGQTLLRLSGAENQTLAIGDMPKSVLQNLTKLLSDWAIPITGTGGFDQAQVTAGGVCLQDFTENLESKLEKGIFAAGEVLNIDGDCGGYNLQWAWSSALAAAEGIL